MKKFTAKDLLGFVRGLQIQEEREIEFYERAKQDHEQGSIKYESYDSAKYGHLHTKNVLWDVERLIERLIKNEEEKDEK